MRVLAVDKALTALDENANAKIVADWLGKLSFNASAFRRTLYMATNPRLVSVAHACRPSAHVSRQPGQSRRAGEQVVVQATAVPRSASLSGVPQTAERKPPPGEAPPQ